MTPDSAPLLNALQRLKSRYDAPFYVPGHKRGQGIHPNLKALLGDAVFRADVPELPQLDNLFAPERVIRDAQLLAAQTFGAEQTWFLANGSTSGVEAMVLATCRPSDKLILPRNVHQSAIAALILSGAMPIFLTPEVDPQLGIAHGVAVEQVATALGAHPDAKAVLLVSPTYYGVCSDVAAIAHLVHQHNIPLLVDEAHGAHLAFHPDLPTGALESGADLVVQSTHKVLSSLTQSAMLHSQGSRISPARVQAALTLVQSTSPSFLLLASLDAARQQMAESGFALMAQTVERAKQARDRLTQLPHLALLDRPTHPQPGFSDLDPTRLTVDVRHLGRSGFEVDEQLDAEWQVVCELPGLHSLTFVLTLGNTDADIDRLVKGFEAIATQTAPHIPEPLPQYATPDYSLQTCEISPREAFFSDTEDVPMAAAVGRIAAELVCPYPPGIPALFPGERIEGEAIARLQILRQAGVTFTGCRDPSLETVRVVC
ncbi:MAG: aminotransferase class I/II-fold pyridoxal phosphate-dependent enzyme [Cyanobacteria bacterium J06638_22]